MYIKIQSFLAVLIFLLLPVSACSSQLREEEAYIIVDQLLSLEPHSENMQAALSRYKEWSELYLEYWSRLKKDDPPNKDVKIYLLLVFSAYESASAETTEHIAQTFLPIFTKNSGVILEVLASHYFLVRTTCRAIDRGVKFKFSESRNNKEEAKEKILGQYRNLIKEALNRNNIDQRCLMEIEGMVE